MIRTFFRSLLVLVAFAFGPPASTFWHGTSVPTPPACAAGQGGGTNLRQANLFSPSPSICFTSYYTPGTGDPAVSTSDYYHTNGLYWWKFYDLATMGPEGAAVIVREGKRFAWLSSPDHPEQNNNWSDSANHMVGFSDDPGIAPATLGNLLEALNLETYIPAGGVGTVSYRSYHTPWMVYNPDAVGDKFWIYTEGLSISTSGGASPVQHIGGLYTSSDLSGFATSTEKDPPFPTTLFNGWRSFERPVRVGPGNWVSEGFCTTTTTCSGPPNGDVGMRKSTSPDGLVWTETGSIVVQNIGQTTFTPITSEHVTIGSQLYQLAREDNRNLAPNGNCDATDPTVGMWVTLVPINPSTFDVLSSPAKIRISDRHYGCFPGPTFLQGAAGTVIEGVYHVYAIRGFPTSSLQFATLSNIGPTGGLYTGEIPFKLDAQAAGQVLTVFSSTGNITVGALICMAGCAAGNTATIQSFGTGTGGAGTYNIDNPATFARKADMQNIKTGGLWQQFVDYYTIVVDAAAAAQAAPFGVRASASTGLVSLSWYDALPNHTYRVKRSRSKTGPFATVADVTGGSYVDNPTTFGAWYYQIVTMEGAVERGSRVVGVYSEVDANARVNAHLWRAFADGANMTTCDIPWQAKVDKFLADNNLYGSLEHWADPGFCVKESGGFIIKVYDYGTTRLPRGGDYIPCANNNPCTGTNTTYSPNALNSFAPAWVNGLGSSHGFFGNGRLNNIRRKVQATAVAIYQKPGTAKATLLGIGEFRGMQLQHLTGNPGTVSFTLTDDETSITSSTAQTPASSATGAHIIAGVYDGTSTFAYADGVQSPAGTPQLPNNTTLAHLSTLKGKLGFLSNTTPFLGSGATGSKYSTSGAAYQFNEAEGLANFGGLVLLDKGLTSTQVGLLTALWKDRIGVPAQTLSVQCGGTNDTTAFNGFNTTAVANQGANPGWVELTLNPNGATTPCVFPNTSAATWTFGIKQLKVVTAAGQNVPLTNGAQTSSMFFLGGGGLSADTTHSARTQSVTAGSTCVTLVTSSQTNRFTPGNYAMMAGFTIQGAYGVSQGYPANFQFFDYVKVLTAAGGQVCFEAPLSHSYRSTWPAFAPGTLFEMDQGGPATLYSLPASWDTRQFFRNITITQTGDQTKCQGLQCILDTVTLTGADCVFPTQNYDMRFVNVTGTACSIEIDKLTTFFGVYGGTILRLKNQSSSIGLVTVNQSNITLSIAGTPQRFIGYKATLAAWGLGPTAFGRADSSICVECILPGGITLGQYVEKGTENDVGINNLYTMSGGIIAYPSYTKVTGITTTGGTACGGAACTRLIVNSSAGFFAGQNVNVSNTFVSAGQNSLYTITIPDGTHIDIPLAFAGTTFTGLSTAAVGNKVPRWAAPGTNVCWNGGGVCERIFQVLDVTQTDSGVGGTINIQTTEPAGFPNVPLTAGKLFLMPHPASSFTCVSCTGTEEVVAISAGHVPGRPLYEYNQRTYTAAIGTTQQPTFGVWGNVSQINYNVTTNAASTQIGSLTQFNNWLLVTTGGSAVYSGTGPKINMQSVGNRQVTLAGSSCVSGTCTGDTGITLPDSVLSWFMGASGSGWSFSTNLSAACPGGPNCSAITITLQTNQGVVNPRRVANDNDSRVVRRRRRIIRMAA